MNRLIIVVIIVPLIWLLFGVLTADVGEDRLEPHSEEWYRKRNEYR